MPATVTSIAVESSGNSIYHGLLFSTEKRFTNGLSFLLSYTFRRPLKTGSPALDSTPAGSDQPQDPRNLRLERGLSPHDVRSRFIYSYVYELPFGKGKRFVNSAPRALDLLLGGWQTNGVASLQTERRTLTFINSFDVSNTGTSNPRANESRDPTLPDSQRSLQRWFDTSAVALPLPYTYGNAGRNTGLGPGQVNFDMSFFKNIVLTEHRGSFSAGYAAIPCGILQHFQSSSVRYTQPRGRNPAARNHHRSSQQSAAGSAFFEASVLNRRSNAAPHELE